MVKSWECIHTFERFCHMISSISGQTESLKWISIRYLICDVTKQNESELANTDFKI